MSSGAAPAQSQSPEEIEATEQRREEIRTREPRNLLAFALYEIVFRVAWIFKTESVIVPAFLDALTGGAGAVRGWLPILSRLGQSLPPVFLAERMRDAPSKSRILRWTSLLMGVPTAGVAVIAWTSVPEPASWAALAFLALYVAFFSITGLNQLAQGTLHGKLIRAERRGRLMWIGGTLGPLLAIVAAWFVLGPWLSRTGVDRFMPIFALTAAGFMLCGLITFGISEPPDGVRPHQSIDAWRQLKAAWWVYHSDAAFRRAARVVMLMTCIVLIFPHFQWLARVQLGEGNQQLMWWVVAQNVGVACFSPLAGWAGDRFGNRVVLRWQCVILAIVPLLALYVTSSWGNGQGFYWTIFLLLGMSPVAMRTINNYTLELAEPELHPLYLSTMRLCFLIPFVFSPIAGGVLDLFSDRPYTGACWLFGVVSGLIALAGLLTFQMTEPRSDRAR